MSQEALGMLPAELRGLSNLATTPTGDAIKYAYHKINISGALMNERDCQSKNTTAHCGVVYGKDDFPCPETTKTTLKRLRREAKRIRKEIAAVKKQAKRNAQAEATALAKARKMREDYEFALQVFRIVAARPRPGDKTTASERIAAAEKLINYSQEG